ncbi:MAG: murein biosynthesis integral membrane protein MurJ [Ilumatobacteraceae bacterium]
MTICTLLSRVSGFGRVLAIAAVLGTGALGDVYQTANMVPNLLFEFVALGVLQAVLLPAYVEAYRTDGQDGLTGAVRATMGVTVGVLGIVSVIAMVVSPLLTRLVLLSEPSSVVADAKLDVMVPMVLVFVPQLIFYGLATTVSAGLHAQGRFVAAALAPMVNNVIVIAACLTFRWMRDGAVADLDLTVAQFVVIAGGTTLGVLAFALLPAVSLSSSGVGWSPGRPSGHPAVRQLRANFRSATLSIVGTFAPMVAALVLGNGSPGGVAIFFYAFAFFVLPHALIAVPMATTAAPRVALLHQAGEPNRAAEVVDRAVRLVVPLLALGGAGMVGLAWRVADTMAFGQTATQGLAPIAHALMAFGPGLLGYGISFILVRVLYALGDVRNASRLMIISAAVGVVTMIGASVVLPVADRAAALAIGYGAAQTVAAALLSRRVHRLIGAVAPRPMFGLVTRAVVTAGGAAVTMMLVTTVFGDRRRESAVAIVVAGLAGSLLFVAVLWNSLRGEFGPAVDRVRRRLRR